LRVSLSFSLFWHLLLGFALPQVVFLVHWIISAVWVSTHVLFHFNQLGPVDTPYTLPG
jgi:hypothetical protein